MKEFKKNNYRFWHSPIALGLIFLGVIFWGYKIVDLAKRNIETICKKELVSKELERLKKKEEMLDKDISRLKTEEGLEEIIREKLPVVKEGEKMVTITDRVNENYSEMTDKDDDSFFCRLVNKGK